MDSANPLPAAEKCLARAIPACLEAAPTPFRKAAKRKLKMTVQVSGSESTVARSTLGLLDIMMIGA